MTDERTLPLLVELLVEELPPKTLMKLGDAFSTGIADSLRAHGLLGEAAAAVPFATPRRLAVRIDAVRGRAADRAVSHKLMPASVGLDGSGAATPALLKRLAALGADAAAVPALVRRVDGKSETLYLDGTAAGATLAEGLQRALDDTLARLPIAKVMQYQLADGWTSVSFVRPAHGLVAMHGSDVVPVRALGLESGRTTRGHRFEATRTPVTLRAAESYEQQLRDEGAVIASFDGRRAEIVRQLQAASSALALAPVDDEALLDEVTALVERPNVITCKFDEAFLAVPPECLVLTMKANQKYFPLLDPLGALSSHFLVVSNLTAPDMHWVIEGNERVVRPRLADAKFFFDQDKRRSLSSRVVDLDHVVYHAKLGTQGQRTERVSTIALAIAATIGKPELFESVRKAAHLAKADLTTLMVGEFPELQGMMGRCYALHDGESAEVAFAIEDHWRPRFAGDALPRSESGAVVAMADKLESLAGLFSIGSAPTGDKDPFALRRAALGVVRLLVDRLPDLDLRTLLPLAGSVFAGGSVPEAQLREFLLERLAVWMREAFSANEVEAVMGRGVNRLSEVPRRLADLHGFWTTTAEAPALAAAYKRVANILKKVTLDRVSGQPVTLPQNVDPELLVEPAELALFEAVQRVGRDAERLFNAREYAASLAALAALKKPIDDFFENVMVHVDDPRLRANRLGLLSELGSAMTRVADLSKLAS